MKRRHPRATHTDTFRSYTTLFRAMNGDDTRTAQFAWHFRLDQLQIDDAALRIATGGNVGTPRSKADIDGTQKNMLKSLDAERDPDVVIRSVKLAGDRKSVV